MAYNIDETAGDILFEVKGDKVIFKLKPGVGQSPGGGAVTNIIKKFDEEEPTDSKVYSALRTLLEISKALAKNVENTDQRYLRKDIADSAEDDITFKKDIIVDNLTKTFKLTVEELSILAKAIVDEIGSSKFVPGFDGEGFKIWQTIAGKWHGELDTLTIRETMTVFELLIEKIRALKGALVVSQGNGRVKNVTVRGTDYVIEIEDDISFVADDFVRFQMFSGKEIRNYWVKVSSIEGNSIVVPISEFNSVVPSVGDELVQMGNQTNQLRQSLLYISASEDGRPRFDVLSGVNSKSLAGHLKVRVGCLDGINDPDFPAEHQPSGYGIYGYNAFLKGVFVLQNGNTVEKEIQTSFQILDDRIKSEVSSVRVDFAARDNLLRNASFTKDTAYWVAINDIKVFSVGGKLLALNNNFYSNKNRTLAVVTDGGRTSIRLKNIAIKQLNEYIVKPPKVVLADGTESYPTFYLTFMCRAASAGTLKIGFEGTPLFYNQVLEASEEYKEITFSGTWDTTGDFIVSYDGDIYIHNIHLGNDLLQDYKIFANSKFEQTSESISILVDKTTEIDGRTSVLENAGFITTASAITLFASKTEFDSLGDRVSLAESSINLTSENISLLVNRVTSVEDRTDVLESAGFITTAESQLLYVKKETFNTLDERVSLAESNISLNTSGISAITTSITAANDRIQVLESAGFITSSNAASLFSTKEEVDALGLRITSSDARITAAEEQLTLKVSTTDYSGQSVVSMINQTSSDIRINASKVAFTAYNQNLVRNSGNYKNTNYWTYGQAVTGMEILGGGAALKFVVDTSISYYGHIFNRSLAGVKLWRGRQYTLRISIYSSVAQKVSFMFNADSYGISKSVSLEAMDQEVVWTFTPAEDMSAEFFRIFILKSCMLFVNWLKFEEGEYATQWSPHPSDSIYSLDSDLVAALNGTTITGGLQLTTKIKLGMLSGGTWSEQAGISANIDNIMLWAGGTYNDAVSGLAKTILYHDGSGKFTGKLQSSESGRKVVIDPSNDFKIISLINNGSEMGVIGFDSSNGYGYLKFGSDTTKITLATAGLIWIANGVSKFSVQINAYDKLSLRGDFPTYAQAASGEVYRNDSNVLAIK